MNFFDTHEEVYLKFYVHLSPAQRAILLWEYFKKGILNGKDSQKVWLCTICIFIISTIFILTEEGAIICFYERWMMWIVIKNPLFLIVRKIKNSILIKKPTNLKSLISRYKPLFVWKNIKKKVEKSTKNELFGGHSLN